MRTRSSFNRLLAVITTLSAAAGSARAQSAGGYSAGPGLAAPGAATEPKPSDDPDAKEFRTDITAFKPSPTFTQVREFTTTRMWVLDPGQFTVEQWWNGGFGAASITPNATNQGSQFFQTEIEMGIYKHVQLDIYANYQFGQKDNGDYHVAPGGHTGIAAEVRVAIGDYWGQIWGNPTLYFELQSQYYNSPRAEVRLLLGGNIISSKLLGALNLAFERNIFRDDASGIDYELKAAYGVNYEIIPDALRFGIEGVLGFDSHGNIDPNAPGGVAIGQQKMFPVAEIGPSVVVMTPDKRFKILAAMLFGLAEYDQPYQPTVIVSTSF
jgi:hypothetical protein